MISIHALREEGDRNHARNPEYPKQISIHALREEGDRKVRVQRVRMDRFLSTPSARRATVQADSLRHPGAISIHALREEGDMMRRFSCSMA